MHIYYIFTTSGCHRSLAPVTKKSVWYNKKIDSVLYNIFTIGAAVDSRLRSVKKLCRIKKLYYTKFQLFGLP